MHDDEGLDRLNAAHGNNAELSNLLEGKAGLEFAAAERLYYTVVHDGNAYRLGLMRTWGTAGELLHFFPVYTTPEGAMALLWRLKAPEHSFVMGVRRSEMSEVLENSRTQIDAVAINTPVDPHELISLISLETLQKWDRAESLLGESSDDEG